MNEVNVELAIGSAMVNDVVGVSCALVCSMVVSCRSALLLSSAASSLVAALSGRGFRGARPFTGSVTTCGTNVDGGDGYFTTQSRESRSVSSLIHRKRCAVPQISCRRAHLRLAIACVYLVLRSVTYGSTGGFLL